MVNIPLSACDKGKKTYWSIIANEDGAVLAPILFFGHPVAGTGTRDGMSVLGDTCVL